LSGENSNLKDLNEKIRAAARNAKRRHEEKMDVMN
jgi:hypothetical protein